MTHHVAIVGAGFSGTLQAINLLRHDGPRATLIERAEQPGLGLAYGAAQPDHILNVRAGNMSALPDDPGHFVRWLESEGVVDAARQFAPRRTFGRYLKAMLDDALASCGGRLSIMRGEVTQVNRSNGGARIALADGRVVDADAAVLAVGNLPPHTPPGFDPDVLQPPRYFGDPWAADVTDGLADDDSVLVIGTGLTMIDTVLSLDACGFRGRIVALSRRGLIPRAHEAPGASWDRIGERPETVASELVASLRTRAGAIGWRNAVDELRPFTQFMWGNASEAERGRFLRHLRPWWDVHRHRLAPEVAAKIEALVANGRLTILSGKTLAARETAAGIAVDWRRRGADATETLTVRRVINCTGPLGDLGRTTDPLLRDLTARGLIRADAHRIGIDVDNQARTIAAGGQPNDWLYALGPMTRGAFWEIVAVPDIRQQTWALARRLSNAHWVGAEGL